MKKNIIPKVFSEKLLDKVNKTHRCKLVYKNNIEQMDGLRLMWLRL